MSNIIQFKVSDDFNTNETPTSDVSLYFPFKYEKSVLHKYRAQLFCANSTEIRTISLGIGKESNTTVGNIGFTLKAYSTDAGANYGLDGTALNVPVNLAIGNNIPKYELFNESVYVLNHIPYTDISFVNPTTNVGVSVTKGNFYWLEMNISQIYDTEIDGFVTPDLYFLTTDGYAPLGDYQTLNTEFSVSPSMNPAPIRSNVGDWNFADPPRDHIMLLNDISPVLFTYSLDNITYKTTDYADAEPLFGRSGWQPSGVYDISIIDDAIGGSMAYGDKIVYIKFLRDFKGNANFSAALESAITYIATRPIVTEIITSYYYIWE